MARAKKNTTKPAAKPAPHSPLSGMAFTHSIGIVAYIALVSVFMFYGEEFFGKEDTYLMPIVFLSLFTLSAAVVGSLMFGKPVMLYLNGKKRDAVQLVGATIGFLAVEVMVLLIALGISRV
jgi:hypothetical protein